MKNATMLYKCPGPHEIHGGHFDYTIVDADEEGVLEQAVAEGWHLTTNAAKEAGETAVVAKEPAPTQATAAKAPSAQAKAKSAPAQPWAKE